MSNKLNGLKVLIVDDEEDIRDYLKWEFEDLGAQVFEAGDVESAFEMFCTQKPDISIFDIRMPSGSGVDLLHKCKSHRPNAIITMMTGYTDVASKDIFAHGACEVFSKPVNYELLFEKIERYLESDFRKRFLKQPGVEVEEEVKLGVNFKELIAQGNSVIGAGGVCIALKRPDFGEVDKVYQIQFKDGFEFTGKVLWRERAESREGLIAMGIEVFWCSEELLDLMEKANQEEFTSFVPKIE